LKLFQTSGTAGAAEESKDRSEELLERARRAHEKAEGELRPQLENAVSGVAEVQQMSSLADETDKQINRMLESIPSGNYLEPQTREAMRLSQAADQEAQGALNSIQQMVAQLPSYIEDARQIPKDVDDTSKKIGSSNAHSMFYHF